MGSKTAGPAVSFFWFILIFFFLIFPFSNNGFAQEDSICARVKIEIKQELTLERQAFEAHMRINNGLTHTALETIEVNVWFTDADGETVLASSDPDNTEALFFIRVDRMNNIDNISGSGSVPADSSSDIYWLIIPAPGASNGLSSGTLYNVGATLTYRVGGEENVIEVTPDYIFVKPLPELTLDYFLPRDVYGDDPFTPEIEPSIPFSLGVRVKNTGAGGARNLKIDSAQPVIKDNDQGLLINFHIQGSEVNGVETPESLLVDFGTIEPGNASIARWIMNCSLSGRFVDFIAQYSHADELGGELTSLIEDIRTHTLVRDVMVDLPGRDEIRDFLSKEGEDYRVYESDSEETLVTDQSVQTTLDFSHDSDSESHYTLSTPVTDGFMMVRLADPTNGGKILKRIIRSDGKEIRPENGWISKTQNRDTREWSHFFNLFDVNTTDAYTVIYGAVSDLPQPPVLQFISDKSVVEGNPVSFIVEASDPNGTIPVLSAAALPVGAGFTDNRDGTGTFDWTPVKGQKGEYTITFSAADPSLSTSCRVRFTVHDINDTDMDGMNDEWELSNFGVLERDGSGDFDGDGISDLQEFTDNTDPTQDESAPSIPAPLYPHPNIDVAESSPELVIVNSSDTQDDTINYEFEIYTDPQMTDMVANQNDVVQMFNTEQTFMYNLLASTQDVPLPRVDSTTNWQVPVILPDNTRYYWRVRSSDNQGSSLWAYQDFFVNTRNDPPDPFFLNSPEDEAEVDSLTPVLSVLNSRDIDNDIVTYTFEVYEDPEMERLVISRAGLYPGDTTTSWTIGTELSDQTRYFWRAIASDTSDAQTATPLYSFYVNTANHAPEIPQIIFPDGQTEVETTDIDLGVDKSEDPDLDPVTYFFEIDTSETFDSPDKQTSGETPEGMETTFWQAVNLEENRHYHWRVKASDGRAQSAWATATFFVNRINDAPSRPTLKNPGNAAWVDTRTPVLSLHPTLDPDRDQLAYRFEVYSNEALTRFVIQGESPGPDWTVPVNLRNNIRYFWRAQAIDEHGVSSDWTPVSDFFVNVDLINQRPDIEIMEPFEDLHTKDSTIYIRWTDSDPDSSAVIALYYDTDNEGNDGVLIVDNISEDPDSDQDTYTWDVSTFDDGIYYIYARISDEDNDVYRYAPVKITIDRTPPVLTVTPEPGNFSDPQFIEITADEDAHIYYTLDGTEPGIHSLPYTGPVEISETTILKCMARDAAGNDSQTRVFEYLFNLESILLTVTTDSAAPIKNTSVYVFREAGSYYGVSGKTDSLGTVLFNPADFDPGLFKFRIDYLGHRFWSNPVQLPDQMATKVIIPTQTLTLNVTATSGVLSGYKVHLFSESGAYLGQYQRTDDQGRVSFELPVGVRYKFRADVLGTQYWTDPIPIQDTSPTQAKLETGGGRFTVTLQKDADHPIQRAKLYLFNPSGAYLGQHQRTDEHGRVVFEVPEAGYKIRADYMGYQFWTDITHVGSDTAIELTLAHKDVAFDIFDLYQEDAVPLAGIKVYLFTPANTYLGLYQTTDAQGRVSFSLPDRPYKVRADYLGGQFWSQEVTGHDTPVRIASALAEVSVTGSGLPQPGLKLYLFSEAGSYLGRHLETDESGQATFRLPKGRYTFRTDYEGSQFWSPVADLAPDMANPVEISVGGGEFTFSARTDSDDPLAGFKCHVFTETNTYIGLYAATDTNGECKFDLADGTYRFRLDYMGEQFWSDPVTVPDQLSHQMILAHGFAQVTVRTKNSAVQHARVYLFSDTGSYLGQYQTTDDQGLASFRLPAGVNYRFRADVLGSRQWSETVQITDTVTHPVHLDAGGGLLTATLQTDDLIPIPGVKMYLFTQAGSYTGIYNKTDDTGRVSFEVPHAEYKLRADYMGYQFWTDPVTLSDDLFIDQTLLHHNSLVTLLSVYQGESKPLAGIKIHLFNSSDSYLGHHRTSDGSGQASFLLPDQTYKIRADYLSGHIWSVPFQFMDAALMVPHGKAVIRVMRSGSPVPDVNVYLFNDKGAHLGWVSPTNETGDAEFLLPADRSFTFRIDVDGQRYWSDPVTLVPDQETPVEMEVSP